MYKRYNYPYTWSPSASGPVLTSTFDTPYAQYGALTAYYQNGCVKNKMSY